MEKIIRKYKPLRGFKEICMIWTQGPHEGEIVGMNGGPVTLIPRDAKSLLQGKKPEGGYHLWDEVFGKVKLVTLTETKYYYVPTTEKDIKEFEKALGEYGTKQKLK